VWVSRRKISAPKAARSDTAVTGPIEKPRQKVQKPAKIELILLPLRLRP